MPDENDPRTGEGAGPEPSPNREAPGAPENLMVVGIGASAGGLEAMSDLLRYLPATTGMALVVVQHLDPHHESALPELLAGKTQMPVIQVHGETPVERDRLYVIAPNTVMFLRDGKLTTESRPSSMATFKPIDALFYSLADELQFNSVGIVLSGTASDGTLGLKAIKAAGGITFAQNQSARFDSMPRSAIAAGAVDFVLPPRRIAEELVAIARRVAHPPREEFAFSGDGSTLHRLLLLLRNNTGVDFTQYKQPTIFRRLNRRMVLRKVENLDDYYSLVQSDAEEARALFDDLLINVTDFFRDPEVFEILKKKAFPSLLRSAKQPRVIRAWIPGCSTGEEVYSLAIALVEYLEAEDLDCRLQLFGTDVSESTIDAARSGIFSESCMSNVSPERLRRFFQRSDSGYQISRSIREMCVFSRHNVAKDPPLSRMNLLSCRNLLIYFAPSLQRRIVATFAYSLQPGGCLLLGPSETLGSLADHFSTIDESHKIYSRMPTMAHGAFHIPDVIADEPQGPIAPLHVARAGSSAPVQKSPHHVFLSGYGPAGIVINELLQITESRGDIQEYLCTQTLEPGTDVMASLRPDLRAPVASAIEEARRSQSAVVADARSEGPGKASKVTVTVVPLALTGGPPHFLILMGRGESSPAPRDAALPEEAPSASDDQDNWRLKQELKSTREYLQSVIEELRSANEEAQSANEELQSTNEEMQTSREELQSSNEELNTINMEMQSRNAELKQINDDLTNLLGSMNVPIVMTGTDLRIRRFTPISEKTLRLIATDVGRPIADLKPRINVPNLEDILKRVLETLQPVEHEVQDQDGRSYLMRVRPYRTTDNHIGGTVLQLLDVTDLKRGLEEVKHARDYAEAIVNTVREALVVLNEDLNIQNANRAFFSTFGLTPSATLNRKLTEVDNGRFDVPEIRSVGIQLVQDAPIGEVEIEQKLEPGGWRALQLSAGRFRTADSQPLFLLAFHDITERKRAAEARFRRLFESARDGIFLVDFATAEIIDLNPFAERLFDTKREELVGRKIWEIHPTSMDSLKGALEQVRERAVLRFDELAMRTRSSRDILVELVASTHMEGERRVVQFNMRDISERRKFERELQASQKLESVGLLAGGIAHDFNNLLTGILGNASLGLTESTPDSPLRWRLRQILDAGERAAFLTRQLLAYAGKGVFVTTRLAVDQFVREIEPLLKTSIARSIDLKLDLPDGLLVEADPIQLQQVVMNLVVNAAEAIPENEAGRITIRACARQLSESEVAELYQTEPISPGNYVQLEVIDTGSGMSEEMKSLIFDPFFTTKFTGRGLGLAAVRGIVRAHKGTVQVYSTIGHGSTFLILLPAAPPEIQDGQARQRLAAPDTIAAGTAVLVIDDEPAILEFARTVLQLAGTKVLTAKNTSVGVEMLRENRDGISVVMMDLQTPSAGAQTAIPLLRLIKPAIPVILTSGFDAAEARRRSSAADPVVFLQKPFSHGQLVDAVIEALKYSGT